MVLRSLKSMYHIQLKVFILYVLLLKSNSEFKKLLIKENRLTNDGLFVNMISQCLEGDIEIL
jgi:hypothetical protein